MRIDLQKESRKTTRGLAIWLSLLLCGLAFCLYGLINAILHPEPTSRELLKELMELQHAEVHQSDQSSGLRAYNQRAVRGRLESRSRHGRIANSNRCQ